MATSNGPMTIRLCYCPVGQLLRGKPQPLPEPTGDQMADRMKRRMLLADMKGFYIAQNEVSLREFAQVLGQPAVEQVFERMVAADRTEGRGDEYPIRGVTVFEAAQFCETLPSSTPRIVQTNPALEEVGFRLPTHDEWQYACRAISVPEQASEWPHFNNWPALQDLPADVRAGVQADCQDVWTKKLNETTTFAGTQEQVVRVIESHENPARGIEILGAFLDQALGTKRSYVQDGQLQPVDSGTCNAWKVFNMHGNVFEWALTERDAGRVSNLWEMLVAHDEQALMAEEAGSFFLAGGGYNFSLSTDVSEWVAFSIWGGQPMTEGQPLPYTFTSLQEQNIVSDRLPGFRFVMERVLAKDWLYVIREAAILNANNSLEDIKKQLAEHRQTVSRLSAGSQLAQAQGASATTRLWRATARTPRRRTPRC